MPCNPRNRGGRYAGTGSHAYRQSPFAGGGRVAQQRRHTGRLDRRQPAYQAGQRHALLQPPVQPGSARRCAVLGKSRMMADESMADVAPSPPNTLPRPDGELEQLQRVWKRPTGWRALTVVNNNHVGLLYIGTA